MSIRNQIFKFRGSLAYATFGSGKKSHELNFALAK